MLVENKLRWAPWVIGNRNILLGPKLSVIRVSHLHVPDIPQDKVNSLIEKNYLIKKTDQKTDIGSSFLPKLEIKASNSQLNWIWISDRAFLKMAPILKKCLSELDGSAQWEIVANKKIILENLKKNHSKKPLIIRLAHKEPIEEKIALNLYADLIDKTQIIWIGETTEGTHLGPVICTRNDLKKYLYATKTWYCSKKLLELGFKNYWPLFIYSHLSSNPNHVAKAILHLVKAPLGNCFLLEENREVCLWNKLIEEKISESNFFKTQFWSKGLIRNFQVNQFDSISEAYVAKCRTPCKSIDYLEGNSGKGIDSSSATYSLVGESVERFSAWQSNKGIVKFNKPQEIQKKMIYDLYQFHPFGPKWENYLASSNIDLPLCEVKDLITKSNICLVPECLIPFPYEASNPQYNVTASSTAGLAVHSDYKKAVINGSLELFERDDLYSSFLFQKIGSTLDFSKMPPTLEYASHSFTLLLNRLKSNQLHYWCIVYNLKSTLPIVHCLIYDQKNKFFSRGCGSGYSLLEAASSSLLEALQIRHQFLRNNTNEASKGYSDWRAPSIIDEIHAYLEKFQKLPFSDHPLNSIQYTPVRLLNEIKKNITMAQKPLLIANLPCPIIGWHAVRVLIPGFTTHQCPSESLGGKKIINPIFKHSIPS